jgi:hypothetical protein
LHNSRAVPTFYEFRQILWNLEPEGGPGSDQPSVESGADCTFIRVSGSELVQKYIGEGSRMVRELFVMAREHAPSIIFMDEIDSIGSARMESGGGGDSEVQRTMLELLNQLDGFEATNKIKASCNCVSLISEENRCCILDYALQFLLDRLEWFKAQGLAGSRFKGVIEDDQGELETFSCCYAEKLFLPLSCWEVVFACCY